MSREFREPILIVWAVGLFFESLATVGKNFLPLRHRRHDSVTPPLSLRASAQSRVMFDLSHPRLLISSIHFTNHLWYPRLWHMPMKPYAMSISESELFRPSYRN